MTENSGAAERSAGTPSPSLAEALGAQDAGTYQSLTDAASERGVFHLVGGYLDDQGVVHNEIHLRSMSGDEEDMLGNRSVPILDRMAAILTACTERIGTLVERGQIAQAINRLPLGTRTHAIICLRRVTHWKRTKDLYDMDVRCPVAGCEKVGSYAVNLAELEVHDMPYPDKRVYGLKLLDSGCEVTWRVASSPQERVLSVVDDMEESRLLTFVIMVRLETIDGQDVRLSMSDLLTGDGKKIKLSKKAEDLFNLVRKLSVGDREDIRADVIDKEPSVDTDLEFECVHCHKPFSGSLNIGQETFFFPSATSKRLRQKSST
jgi:hypothetical protein